MGGNAHRLIGAGAMSPQIARRNKNVVKGKWYRFRQWR